MGCSCKKTPLQRVERKIQYWGWEGLAPSDIKVVDSYIQSVFKVLPTTDEERKIFYTRAKQKEKENQI